MDAVIADSDNHWGNGSDADIANYPGADAILEAVISSRPLAYVKVGDWLDVSRFGRDAVLRYNAERVRTYTVRLRAVGIPFYFCPGNHDPGTSQEWANYLFQIGVGMVTVLDPHTTLYGWEFAHGNEWDAWNNRDSILFPVGYALTRGSAWVKNHLWSKYDESRLDPTRWISPANKGEVAKEFIKQRACAYAAEKQISLCEGHTHQAGHADGDGWRYANCGAVTKTHPVSYVILPETGDSQTVWVEGV